MEKLRTHNLDLIKNSQNNASLEISKNRNDIKNIVSEILENKENLVFELETNLDFFREKLIAEIFGLSDKKIQKLLLDYKENLTLSRTLNIAENFWEYRKMNI